MATLRVTRIPFGVNQETMSRIFSQLGPLSVLNRPATPQESAPFETIIEFASPVAADSAIKAINGFCVAGRRLQVSKYEANPGEGNLPAASKTTVAVSESVKPEEALRVILSSCRFRSASLIDDSVRSSLLRILALKGAETVTGFLQMFQEHLTSRHIRDPRSYLRTLIDQMTDGSPPSIHVLYPCGSVVGPSFACKLNVRHCKIPDDAEVAVEVDGELIHSATFNVVEFHVLNAVPGLLSFRFYLVDKAGLPTGVETRLELTVEEERQKRLHTDYADDERRRTRNRTDLASRGQGLRRTGDARR